VYFPRSRGFPIINLSAISQIIQGTGGARARETLLSLCWRFAPYFRQGLSLMRTVLSSLLGFLVLAVASGCPGGGGTKYTVSGTVTFNSQSVDEGSVAFTPKEGKTKSATVAAIKGGQYTVELPAGSYTVAVYWPKKASGKPDANPYEETGERIPEKFNRKTELSLDVSSGGQQKNWELKGEQAPDPKSSGGK
jgi:hypothetical protein